MVYLSFNFLFPFLSLQLHEIVLQNIPGTKTLRVYDCRGIMPDKKQNAVFTEDLKKVIDGNVMKDYEVFFSVQNLIMAC